MTKNFTVLIIAALLCMISGSMSAQKYVGGDISLLPKYEANGAKYLDHDGNSISDMMTFFKTNGLNAMRVRLFVNPDTSIDHDRAVCQDLEMVKALGKRIKDAGFAFMLDFHYSNTWADPAKQWTPAEWATQNDDSLYNTIYNYTKDVLTQLSAAGATPDLIQTGNEISYGMLWGQPNSTSLKKYYAGQSANYTRFVNLLRNASKACREVCPNAKIIIHTERVPNQTYLVNFYNAINMSGLDYDIIGLSYYPYFHGAVAALNSALSNLESNFPSKKIMIVETGYYHVYQPKTVNYDLSATYPITEAGQKSFTDALITMLNTHSSVTGLFWWWMEANEHGLNWNTKRVTDGWNNSGLWDNSTGKVLSAFFELQNFAPSSGLSTPKALRPSSNVWYTIDGRRISEPTQSGIYIHDGQKVFKR
ncbi:MAG: arabinogalactan endo-1,4-beta-galactosidase [Muribaculaceae bacterium]|jgi:arabinogalactan endo-1,4-beta-galactosidase|nr:arabinogalactan endo-1,4-beta-galactosidase [Muribaculaceae bacterium]